MDEDIIFKPTAFKHGLDRSGNPLEILYNVLDEDMINVFHAMKCRKIYRALVNL
jgi:hypothetical protein